MAMHNCTLFTLPIAFLFAMVGTGLFLTGLQSPYLINVVLINDSDVPDHSYGLFMLCENINFTELGYVHRKHQEPNENAPYVSCCGSYSEGQLEKMSFIYRARLYLYIYIAFLCTQLLYSAIFVAMFMVRKVGRSVLLLIHLVLAILVSVFSISSIAYLTMKLNGHFDDMHFDVGFVQALSGTVLICISNCLISLAVVRVLFGRLKRKLHMSGPSYDDNDDENADYFENTHAPKSITDYFEGSGGNDNGTFPNVPYPLKHADSTARSRRSTFSSLSDF